MIVVFRIKLKILACNYPVLHDVKLSLNNIYRMIPGYIHIKNKAMVIEYIYLSICIWVNLIGKIEDTAFISENLL